MLLNFHWFYIVVSHVLHTDLDFCCFWSKLFEYSRANTSNAGSDSVYKEKAVSVLLSVLELGVNDAKLMRLVGYMLYVNAETKLAKRVFKQVLTQSPSEPQSHRDYALVVAQEVEALLEPCVDGAFPSPLPTPSGVHVPN